MEEKRKGGAYSTDTKCVGLARLGADDQKIAAGSMKDLRDIDFGPPLHCLVVVGDAHPAEDEMLEIFRCQPTADSRA